MKDYMFFICFNPILSDQKEQLKGEVWDLSSPKPSLRDVEKRFRDIAGFDMSCDYFKGPGIESCKNED